MLYGASDADPALLRLAGLAGWIVSTKIALFMILGLYVMWASLLPPAAAYAFYRMIPFTG